MLFKRAILWVLWAIAAAAVAAALLANAMTKQVGRDEQMYCTAGVLMAQGQLPYRDFSYAAQLPYHPLLCAAVFRLTGTTHYLLAGRLVSVVSDLLVAVLIVAVYRRIVGTGRAATAMALAGAALYVFNPLVDYAQGYAWNHDVVILLVLFSLWLLISVDPGHRSCVWKAAAIGACLGLASGMRVTTALTIPVFGLALWLGHRRSAAGAATCVVPWAGGLAATAIWPLWVVTQSPQAFWLDLVEIPRLYGQWLQEIGMTYDKAGLTWQCLTRPGYLAILVLLPGLTILVWQSGARRGIWRLGSFAVTIALVGLFSWSAFIPPTMWHQYWAVPVPFLVVALAFPLSALVRSDDRRQVRAALGLTLLTAATAIATNPVVIWRIPVAADPETWEPLRIHRIAEGIAAKTQAPKRVLTLAPLLALEGGCSIYPELSCGSIIYRIADQLTAAQQRQTHSVGPTSLGRLAEASPPSAIIVGTEDRRFASLETALQAIAGAGWDRQVYPDGLTVYYRPKPGAQTLARSPR